jgi:hypothetical protein
MLVLVVLAIGWLLYLGILLGAMVLAGIVWGLSRLMLWLMEQKPRPTRRRPAASSRPNVRPIREPAKPRVNVRTEPKAQSDIWPKWTAARRQDMDLELSLWQQQFDALNSHE